MADISKRQAREIDRDRFMTDLEELSYARQYFEYARYKTREHDKVELTAGFIVGLLFALVLGSGTWFGTAAVGFLAFAATLVMIFLLHWIRAPSALHQRAIQAARGTQSRRKEL